MYTCDMRRLQSVVILALTIMASLSVLYYIFPDRFSGIDIDIHHIPGVGEISEELADFSNRYSGSGKKSPPQAPQGFDGSCISLARLSYTICRPPKRKAPERTEGLKCGQKGTAKAPKPLFHGMGLACNASSVEGCYRGCFAQNENGSPDICRSLSFDSAQKKCEFFAASVGAQRFDEDEDDPSRRWWDRDCFEARCMQDGF